MDNIPKLNINELFNANDFSIELELPFSKKKIHMREMVTADQKYFLKHIAQLEDKDFVQRKIGVLFNDLISKLVKDVDFKSMTLQDKLFLLLYLRTYTKGSKTTLATKCGKCGAEIAFGYDMENFIKKINTVSSTIKTPIEVTIKDTIFIVDSVTVSDEIESDALASDQTFIKQVGMEEKHVINMLRVASVIKKIITPKGEVIMTDYPMKQRVEVLLRSPTAVITTISETMKDIMEKTFNMLTDKFTVPCLQKGCDGKSEVEVQIGDDGFFIRPSSESGTGVTS